MNLVYFIVLVGVLIFVHEFGHFATAKLFGVKVLKFSLGFGPRVAGFRRGDTEYVIAAVPLGGYVRMLGEAGQDDPGQNDAPDSFSNQALWKRTLIVCAGPAMNLLFPVLLYFVVFLGAAELHPPEVAWVIPGTPADGKLQPDDRIVAIDGDELRSFEDLTRLVRPRPEQKLAFTIVRDGQRSTVEITPALVKRTIPILDTTEEIGQIGVARDQPLAVIGITDPGGPAAEAGLQTFDRVISMDGAPVDRWIDVARRLDNNRGATTQVGVLRPEPAPGALGEALGLHIFKPRLLQLSPDAGKEPGPARAGLEPGWLYVSHVAADSAADKAGLQVGDRLLSLDGKAVRYWGTFLTDLIKSGDARHTLSFRRDGKVHEADYQLQEVVIKTEGGEFRRWSSGMFNWQPAMPYPLVPNPSRVSYALREGVYATSEVVGNTFYSILRLIQGRLPKEMISGPIGIFELTGQAARHGLDRFLELMAFISVNLGLINLMPVPVLDGGHLVFFLLEAVTRRPLSLRVREYASIMGLVLLILLMVLAVKNDIERAFLSSSTDQSSE